MQAFVSWPVAVAVLLLSPTLALAAVDVGDPQPLGDLIDAGGYRVHLYCTGSGTPTVVIAGGFSFDWALVQPGIAKFTRVCTYDPSGVAWSDRDMPVVHEGTASAPSCSDRITELHKILKNGKIAGPYVLVGYSFGGLVARLFCNKFPDDVVGMIIVDHAFVDVDMDTDAKVPSAVTSNSANSGDRPPVLIFSTPIALDLEDDRNFSRLPLRSQTLHLWAKSVSTGRPSAETARGCISELETAVQSEKFPLLDRPLTVISTSNDSPGYGRLQAKLTALSRHSRQVIATQSSHMVIIDQPGVIIDAVNQMVQTLRR